MTDSDIPAQADSSGQRGPAQHERREQIIAVADAHFRRYGYDKTSVADIAKEIGVSSAYLYRFFESKQAIGEAICSMTLGRIIDAMEAVASSDESATKRLRKLFKTVLDQGLELFFNERKLHDIVLVAVETQWGSVPRYKLAKQAAIRRIVSDGRASGEFERKTPLDEVCSGIDEAMWLFAHPMMLEQREPEELQEACTAIVGLVLRSLSV
ncbi:TetR/AcrR family transcriptional regulator [Derxia lacustris]|uniref:TetR/AcrR family transcriptional regulator n=1 Tax=Derxia lacustris TaxID=764842 RepID=UPI000A173DB0|nr:TetR/AcrR family transcriptional regulator [Derxia lacustris]